MSFGQNSIKQKMLLKRIDLDFHYDISFIFFSFIKYLTSGRFYDDNSDKCNLNTTNNKFR